MHHHKWKVFVAEVVEPRDSMIRDFVSADCEVSLGRSMMDGRPYSEEEMIGFAKDVDALMGGSRETYTRGILEASPKLRVMSKFGTGVDKIDLKAATDLGILVTNTPVNSLGVAETTMAYILALAKKLKIRDRAVAAGTWRSVGYEQMRGMLLKDKVIGIIGLGRVGVTVAKFLQPWGVEILAYDPWVAPEKGSALGVEMTSLDRLLRESDFVTIHVIGTPETNKMIGEAQFAIMKKTAYVINTARGTIIDEPALVKALRNGLIAGAALDVFEPEPPEPENPLLSSEFTDKVWLAPHTAAYAPEIRAMMLSAWTENCLTVLKGELPPYIVNKEVVPKWQARVLELNAVH
jgi:D-3-phosphoglycerate dehydrogenase / 2-oxoglutarate reductase